MILYLLFTLFIYIANATNTNPNDECFKIEENNIINETTLRIKGNGKMCDCNTNDISTYNLTVETIIFEDSVTSIGSQCFMNFEKLQTIQFGKGISEIEQYAFYQSNIINLTIPKTTTLIES